MKFQPTKFLLDRGVEIVAEIKSSYYRKSPLIPGGLEIAKSLLAYQEL